jgi:predicted O-methyltransferase YrrM
MFDLKHILRPPKGLHNRGYIAQETYARGLLAEVMPEGRYLPVTNSAIPLATLATICNDIEINRRQTVFEFGSGLSTIVMSSLFKKNGIEGKIISVDHDAGWLDSLQTILNAIGTQDYVQLHHAPLVPGDGPLDWYDLKSADLAALLQGRSIDLLLVDGPYAHTKALRMARYPALPCAHPHLSQRCSVFLDDTFRPGEQLILKQWSKAYGLKFQPVNGYSSVAFKGEYWNVML